MSNVKRGPWESVTDAPPPAPGALAGDGDGPHDPGMEARVLKLEAVIPTLATKADIGDVRGDLHKMDASIVRWMLATIIGLFLGFAGLFITMSNALKGSAPAAQTTQAAPQVQPIIIQIPAQHSQPPLNVQPAKQPSSGPKKTP